MKTLAFLFQKGGSGKTTLAINLAVAAYQDGLKVLLIDTDGQKHTQKWGIAREGKEPLTRFCIPSLLDRELKQAYIEKYDLAVIDTTGVESAAQISIAGKVDLCVVPVKPSGPDLSSLQDGTSLVLKNQLAKAAFIINQRMPNVPEAEETFELLKMYKYPVCETMIGNRISYHRAYMAGQAVTEYKPEDKKASNEIKQFYKFVKGILYAKKK